MFILLYFMFTAVVQSRVCEDQLVNICVQKLLSYYNDKTLFIDLVGLC